MLSVTPTITEQRFSRHFLKSMRDRNLYFGPLEFSERILESEMVFKFHL